MFGNSLYDPDAKWRKEPATEAQRKVLAELGINSDASMTKGEASDLIAQAKEPTDEQLEFLEFFGVKLPKGATEYDAVKKIRAIVVDPKNKLLWEARPATSKQKEIIKYVDGSAPHGLTRIEAEKIIQSYWDDETKNAKYEAISDLLEEKEIRLGAIRDYTEMINSEPSAYGLKRVGVRLVVRAVEEMERETGKTLEDLEGDVWFLERLAEKIRELDKSKFTNAALQNPDSFRPWKSQGFDPAQHMSKRGSAQKTSFATVVGWIAICAFLSSCVFKWF